MATVPNTGEFRIVGANYGGTAEVLNTIYVENAAGWTTAALGTTATAIGDSWADGVCPLLPNGYTFVRVDARDLEVEDGAFNSVSYGTAGSRSGTQMSAVICALVILECGGGGLPRKGHLFISPLVEEDVTLDTIDSDFRDALEGAMSALNSDIAAISGNEWVVVSRYHNNVERDPAITNAVTAMNVRPLVATQRDRRPGIGS